MSPEATAGVVGAIAGAVVGAAISEVGSLIRRRHDATQADRAARQAFCGELLKHYSSAQQHARTALYNSVGAPVKPEGEALTGERVAVESTWFDMPDWARILVRAAFLHIEAILRPRGVRGDLTDEVLSPDDHERRATALVDAVIEALRSDRLPKDDRRLRKLKVMGLDKDVLTEAEKEGRWIERWLQPKRRGDA